MEHKRSASPGPLVSAEKVVKLDDAAAGPSNRTQVREVFDKIKIEVIRARQMCAFSDLHFSKSLLNRLIVS